MSKIQKII